MNISNINSDEEKDCQHHTPSKKRKVFSNDLSQTSSLQESPKSEAATELNLNGNGTHSENVADQVKLNAPPGDKSIVDDGSGRLTPESASGASESDWQPPTNGALDWIYTQMLEEQDPREIIYQLMPNITAIPSHLTNWDVWRILIRMMSEPPRRNKLPHINTFNDVIDLIKSSKKIMILTGAGVSVSCGIPDFRSRDGVYARLAVDFPDLPNPEAMFSIAYFKEDPRPFFKFAKEIYPGQFKPSLVHRFIALLEKKDKLLRNYTQNIDTLEQVAGISRVIQCHGSFATATCQVCKHQVDGDAIREDVFNQVVPLCPRCPTGEGRGIMKPDIVFFGENLPDHFHRQMTADKDEADLLIVIGSALKVRPVALIPNSLPEGVPQILINREPLSHLGFDVELLGDGDGVVAEVCRKLGEDYADIYCEREGLVEVTSLPEATPSDEEAKSGEVGPPSDPVDVSSNRVHNMHVSSDQSESAGVSGDAHELKDVGDGGVEMESLKGMWRSRWKQSVSKSLPAGTYYYDGGHRYIFPGAEIPPEEESDSSSDESEDSNDDQPLPCKDAPSVHEDSSPPTNIPEKSQSTGDNVDHS